MKPPLPSSNDGIAALGDTNVPSLSALIAPFLAFAFLHKKYRKSDFVVQIIMVIGLYLLCTKGGLSQFGAGEICALLAATLSAGALVFGRESLQLIHTSTLTFVQILFTAIMCTLLGLFTHSFGQLGTMFTMKNIAILIYASIFSTLGGFLLQNGALKHIAAKLVAMLQCLYPVVAAIVAFLVLGEQLSLLGYTGAAMIIGCVLFSCSMKKE